MSIQLQEKEIIKTPITGAYVYGSTGMISQSANTSYIETELENAKSVRFLGGWYTSSAYTSGYAFGHYTDPTDPATWVTDKSSVYDTNASQLGTKEYIIDCPQNSTHFRATSATRTVPALAQNFYCYLQMTYTVITNQSEWDDMLDVVGKKMIYIISDQCDGRRTSSEWADNYEGTNVDYLYITAFEDLPGDIYELLTSLNIGELPAILYYNGSTLEWGRGWIRS